MKATTQSGPKKNPTRQRILRAALRAFGRYDYDTVSTRAIVERAGANISAISYYFGDKRGLYLATARYLGETVSATLQPEMNRIRRQIPGINGAAARDLLGQLLQTLVRHLLTDATHVDGPGFILREQARPTEAFDILYACLFEPLHRTAGELVATIRRIRPEDPECILLTHAVIGQVIAFRAARTTVLRRLGIADFTSADVDHIATLLGTLTPSPLGDEPCASKSRRPR